MTAILLQLRNMQTRQRINVLVGYSVGPAILNAEMPAHCTPDDAAFESLAAQTQRSELAFSTCVHFGLNDGA